MNERVDRFKRDVDDMTIKDSAAGRDTMWINLGAFLMVAGLAISLIGYLAARRDTDPLDLGAHHSLALLGITSAIVGGALFVRYSLAGFFKFWLARYLHAQRQQAEQRAEQRPDTAAGVEQSTG